MGFYNKRYAMQVFDIMKQRKSVVFTGHSIGGTIASLSALWLLSHLQSMSSPPHSSVLCITFGSPLLGNESLSRDILQERWGGNFCHVVAKHDLVPRLLLAPVPPITPQLRSLLQYWNFSLTSPQLRAISAQLLPDEEKTKLFLFILAWAEESAKGLGRSSDSFWPFGSYLFCGKEGAVCVDNAMAVVQLLHLMLATGCASSCIEDHLKYGDYVGNIVSSQFLKKTGLLLEREESSYEAGITLALQSSGLIATQVRKGIVIYGIIGVALIF